LRLETRQYFAMPGQTIEDILRAIPDLPVEVWTHGAVRIGEWEIPRERWGQVKPKPGSRHLIHVGIRLRGGGGGKNIFATIAAIALIVAATAISGGVLGPAGALSVSSTLFAAGSTSAALLAAGVSIVGALALSALAPAPAVQDDAVKKRATLGSASFRGNVLEPFEPIPFVAGTHRVSPPHLIAPWSESVNDDQIVYAIVGLNGAHAISDIRINNAPIDQFSDVEYEVRDVVTDDSDITLIDKQVFENQIGTELSGHKVKDDQTAQLQDDTTPSNSYPHWQVARARSSPDEIWLTFGWTGLINLETSGGTTPGGMPIRIRIRKSGDVAWINLPELHAQRERQEPFRGLVKLRWAPLDSTLPRIDQNASFPPWKFAFYATNAANAEAFDTDSYFNPGAGNLANKILSEDGVAVVFLDEATFPKGVYDVQVMRGYAYRAGDFTSTTYQLSAATPYFFTHTPASSPPSIRKEQAKVPVKVSWQSVSSVWNDYPLGEKGLTLVAVKARNVSISSLTMLAQGYANIWNGADWNTFAATNNPAAWLRYLALGGQSIRAPFVAAQLDDANLADFHDFCAGGASIPTRECNAYFDGSQSLDDVLRIIAGCGRAALRVSDKIGVVIDRDRSAEAPIQLFSQRNSKGLAIRRAFPRLPDGLRVRFNDETNDYQPKEIFVYRKRLPALPTNIESMNYIGITSEALAIDRAYLDLAQLIRRATLHSFECDIENIYCTKGSLVLLAHDTIARHYDSARVVSVQTSGPNVTGLTLDVPLRLSLVGLVLSPDGEEVVDSNGDPVISNDYPAGVVIQLKDGSTLTKQIEETTDTDIITFTTPFAIPAGSLLEADCLVACGPFASVEKRMLVLGVQPQNDYTAALTLVDEAPAIRILSSDGSPIKTTDASQAVAPF
jgi:hypothetical protein